MKNNPSKFNLLEKGIKFSLNNIWRNKVLSIATIFVMGIIIFIFNIILAINFIAQDSLETLSQKIDIIVYLKESTTFSDAEKISNEILELEGIENVQYTSKQDALEQIKETHPDLSVAFEKYQLGNPLPSSLSITTIHPQYHTSIADFLSQDKYQTYLSNIVTNDDSKNNGIISSVSKNLLQVTNFTHKVIFWLIITFIVGGTLIILNAIQLAIFTRKKEISIMKLVGASHWFIRLPFLIESIIYGILAVIVGFSMLIILSQKIQIPITPDIKFTTIFLIELAGTIVLSALSSFIAVHEHLRKQI